MAILKNAWGSERRNHCQVLWCEARQSSSPHFERVKHLKNQRTIERICKCTNAVIATECEFRSSFVVCCLSFVACRLSFVVCRLSLVVCHWLFVVCHLNLALACATLGPGCKVAFMLLWQWRIWYSEIHVKLWQSICERKTIFVTIHSWTRPISFTL